MMYRLSFFSLISQSRGSKERKTTHFEHFLHITEINRPSERLHIHIATTSLAFLFETFIITLDATVDAIAERAGVSPRTVFNYFPTKEEAVLGVCPARLSEEDAAAFLAGTAPFEGPGEIPALCVHATEPQYTA